MQFLVSEGHCTLLLFTSLLNKFITVMAAMLCLYDNGLWCPVLRELKGCELVQLTKWLPPLSQAKSIYKTAQNIS